MEGDRPIELTDDEREKLYKKRRSAVTRENNRLKELFIGIDPDILSVVTPLINKAAFMGVTLNQLQDDINRDGTIVVYQNGENQWGTKVNPDVQTYNSMAKLYSGIIKQLKDLLPNNVVLMTPEDSEEEQFEDFLLNRED